MENRVGGSSSSPFDPEPVILPALAPCGHEPGLSNAKIVKGNEFRLVDPGSLEDPITEEGKVKKDAKNTKKV